MSGTEYEFYALTPIDDADIGVYEEALDFVFENDSVRNVAVSGSYGSGKSSVLASYKKKHPDKKFLHISLAHFRAANGDEDAIGKETEKSTETILEGKILNQLIHQIPPKNIPQTNFKVKKELSKKRIIVTTALVMLGAIFGLLVFFSTQWLEFVQSLSIDYLKNLLWFSGESDTRFFMGVLFFAMVGVFLYRLIKLQENHHIIKRASVSGVEIEVLEDSKESYFDKYLNEVLYLFEKSGAAVIVFEDIDRYDSSKIFERLHEINRLTNDNLMNTKKKPLRFFYLMRDDIFVSKDRAKFFDFILPIVPVVDGSNSYDKFIECFQKSGLIGDEQAVLDQDFLQGLSLYIDDMRILQNICNEFLVYHSRISTTEQDPNKMLALIAVKNLFPRDFADLQLGRGFMFEVIGGHGKERLIESEKARLNEEIESKRKMLEAVQNEHLPSDEIILLYHTKFYIALRGSGTTRFQPSDNPQTCKQDLENNRQYLNQHNALLDEYDTRIETSAASDDEKTRRISDLETKIDDLKAALVKLTGLRLRDIISRDNIKGLFKADFESETGKNNRDFTQIKDSPYFDLLKYLVREGFVDETYSDYMTYFYENSLTRTDKIFLRSITDKKAKEPSYTLDNPQMVISRTPVAYFEQEETLNYALFAYLLEDYSTNRAYVDKAKKLIRQIAENKCFEFFLGYCENAVSNNMISVLGMEWNSFIVDFFTKLDIGNAPTDPKTKSDIFITRYAYALLTLIGEDQQRLAYLDEPSRELLVSYLSKDANFLATDDCDDQKVALGIKRLNICFKIINAEIARPSLLKLVYENNLYILNIINIETMLKAFYSDADLSALQTANYSVIMAQADSPLAKYIHATIDAYMGVLLAECNEVITDEPGNAISLLNNAGISTEKKTAYISYLETTIADIREVDDNDLWGALLANPTAIDYTAANVITYFTTKCADVFDDVLVQYINGKGNAVDFADYLESDEMQNNVFSAIVMTVALDNSVYKGYLEQFKLQYPNFDIANLPIDKLAILDELNIIEMSEGSLVFIRENYDDYIYAFIANHISDYIAIVSTSGAFLRDEMLGLLDAKISDDEKISLLELEKAPISINGKSYSDAVAAHILRKNYAVDDFNSLIEDYSKYGTRSKSVILEKAINGIGNVLRILSNVDRQLISDLLLSDEVEVLSKKEIFKAIAINASESEIKQWLPYVGSGDFLDLDDMNKKPRFENNEWNEYILGLYKARKWIKDYNYSEEFDKFTASRWGKNDSKKKLID